MQIKICMIRGFQRLAGEKTFAVITIVGNLVISLVLGSIFFNLPDNTASFYGRGALLFIAVLFNALTSALEVSHDCNNDYSCKFLMPIDSTIICAATHRGKACRLCFVSPSL